MAEAATGSGADGDADLLAVLEESRRLGFLGPGPVRPHIRHARSFMAAWALVSGDEPEQVLDLGSGGGLPGLVLARSWTTVQVALLDSNRRRTSFLRDAVARLGLDDRAVVLEGRAEDFGRGTRRGTFDLVTARSFGPPAVTAECAAPLLRAGGYLAVADPPDPEPARWPPSGLALLGLESVSTSRAPAVIRLFRLADPPPLRYPRRSGVPAKRPLWNTSG